MNTMNKINEWARVYFKEPDYLKENLKGVGIVVGALAVCVLLFIVLPAMYR
jgi:hypothetical protein